MQLPPELCKLVSDADPVAQAMHADEMELIRSAIQKLPFLDREVLKMQYGLDDGYTWTFLEIGRVFRITPQAAQEQHDHAVGLLKRRLAKRDV